MVPRSLLNEVFSIKVKPTTEYISKLPGMKWIEDKKKMKNIVDYIEKIFGDIHSLNKSEEVIKTPETWIGNMIASFMYVVMEGFEPEEVARGYVEIARMVQDYHKDMRRKYEIILKYGENLSGAPLKVKQEFSSIGDRMKINPINFAMENGLFESSVEDLVVEGELELGNNIVAELIEKGKNKYVKNKMLKKVLEELFMTDESISGKISATMLSYGDFIAKMYLYIKYTENHQQMTLAERNRLMNNLNENFVNYNINSARSLEYLNKTAWFIYAKFLLGMPRSVLAQMKNHPATAGFYYGMESLTGEDVEMMADGFHEGMITGRFRSIVDATENVLTPAYLDLIERLSD